MNEHLNHNACATLVRQTIPRLKGNVVAAVYYWTNTVGADAPDMGLWQITVSKIPEEMQLAS